MAPVSHGHMNAHALSLVPARTNLSEHRGEGTSLTSGPAESRPWPMPRSRLRPKPIGSGPYRQLYEYVV